MSNTANSIVIQKTRIIGTKIVAYSAWTPSSYTGRHQTVTSIDGVCHGKVGTERIPAEIDALPVYTQERADAVLAWYAAQREIAYAAILAAHPEAAAGQRDGMGQIEVVE
jgi:hypothetical protein